MLRLQAAVFGLGLGEGSFLLLNDLCGLWPGSFLGWWIEDNTMSLHKSDLRSTQAQVRATVD